MTQVTEHQSITNTSYFIGLVLFAFIAGYVSIWLSFHYQFHDKIVSWYFPHGVRVVALFLLPFRHWCLFLFFTILGSDSYYHFHISNDEGLSLSTVKNFILYYALEAISGAAISFLYKRYVQDMNSLRGVVGIITLSVMYRFLYLIIPAYFEFGFFTLMPAERYVEFFVAIQLSGYLVGLYILTLALVIKWVFDHRQTHIILVHRTYFVYLGIVLLVMSTLYYLHPSLEYLLRIAVLIPLILFAARYGWFAGMLTGAVISSVLMIYLFDHSSTQLMDYQPFMLMYLLVSLIMSAVVYDNDVINQQHQAAQHELVIKNNKLKDATQRLTRLSRKIINIQEEERKFLSKELHDEIGQSIIALKSSIYLLERSSNKITDYGALKEDADMIYGSVYELMHWLRPATLDKYGLIKTLEGDFFRDKLRLSNIEYVVNIDFESELDEHVETALFRICQEAVTNTMKHSNATTFTLSLLNHEDNVHLQLRDNGTIDSELYPPSGGFGLDSIYERVLTLNGLCLFTQQNGFVIDIKVPSLKKHMENNG